MSSFDSNRFASNKQEYATPWELFNVLDEDFHFDLDVCADKENHKCEKYLTEQDDALKMEWNGTCWMNPPYKTMKEWVAKAYSESRKDGCTVVCLIPSRTNTKWWHEYCAKGEIRFVKGRPKFGGCKHGLPQPLAVVVFSNKIQGNYRSVEFEDKTV